MARRPLYGLDIETNTVVDGLDPLKAEIIAVAICGRTSEMVFSCSESELLRCVDDCLESLEPGILTTWNGTHFDLPFLSVRASLHEIPLGLSFGNPSIWHHHIHLDAIYGYRQIAIGTGLSCKLKDVALRAGFNPVIEDPSTVHTLCEADLRKYVASDARIARLLAEDRWDLMERYIEFDPAQ